MSDRTTWNPFRSLWIALSRRMRRLARGRRSAVPLGRRGELIVGDYLKRLGWKIVARGAESRYSEIDLVAVDGQCIVFVEVKSRTGDDAEAALDAVDWDKQRRLTRAALAYLKRHRLLEHRARFDVVALNWRDQQEAPELSHIRDAFPAVGRGQFYA